MPFQEFDGMCASCLQVLLSHLGIAVFFLEAGSFSLITGHHSLEVRVQNELGFTASQVTPNTISRMRILHNAGGQSPNLL